MYDKKKLERFNSSFSKFEQTIITGFVNSLSVSKSDIYLVMARKAACLVEALIELGILSLNGKVYSERILDMDDTFLSNIFRDKKVTIIDDTIVSGTTISDVVKEIIEYGAESVFIEIITVNKAWYTSQLIEARCNQGKSKGVDIAYSTPVELSDNDSVRFCYDIVKGLSVIPKLYDYDFPRIKLLKWKQKSIYSTFSNDLDWRYFDTATQLQKDNGVFSYTCIPREHILKNFDNKYNTNISKIANFKIRFLGYQSEQGNYNLTAVPITIFNFISKEDIRNVFSAIFKHNDNEQIVQYFTTSASKLRVLQYVLSVKFMAYWMNNIRKKSKKYEDIEIRRHIDKNIEVMLFTEKINDFFEEFNYSDGIDYRFKDLIADRMNNSKSKLENSNDNHIIKLKLIEPFIDFYDNKEIPCRSAVKEYDYSNFTDAEFIKYLTDIKKVEYGRLKHGITFPELCSRINYLDRDYDYITYTSVFLDKMISRGIAVPIIQEDERFLYRAYRHGEDAIMGDIDHRMIVWILKSICLKSGISKLNKITTEKLIALIIKFGVRRGWIDSLPNDDQTIEEHKILVSNKHDLHGMRTKVLIGDKYVPLGEPWYTYYLKKRGYIVEAEDSGYEFKPPISFDPMDYSKGASDINSFSIVFGKILERQKDLNQTKSKSDTFEWQLTKLASCVHPKDIIDALVTEIEIFRSSWEQIQSHNFYDYWQDDDYKKAEIAINSGQIKYYAYINRDVGSIINSLKALLGDALYENILTSFFDLREANSSQKYHENTINILGSWLISMNLAVRILKLSNLLKNKKFAEEGSKECIDIAKAYFNQIVKKINQVRLDKTSFYEKIKQYDETKNFKEICYVLSDVFYYVDKIVPILDSYKLPNELVDCVSNLLNCNWTGAQLNHFIVTCITKLNNRITNQLENAKWEVNNFDKVIERKMFKNCVYIKFYHHNENASKLISKFLNQECKIQDDGFPLVVQAQDSIFNLDNDICIAYREPQQPTQTSTKTKVISLIRNLKNYVDYIEKIFIIQNMDLKYRIEVIKNNRAPMCLVHAHNMLDLLEELSLKDKNIFEIAFHEAYKLSIHNLLGKIEFCEQKTVNIGGKTMTCTLYQKGKIRFTKVKIGIITALQKEFNAMCKLLQDAREGCVSNRGAGHTYVFGTLPAAFGDIHSVAVCYCGQGNNMAGIRATEMIMDFPNLKYIMMSGIAAGAPNVNKPENHVRLGDIVISDKGGVIQYDMIKLTSEGIEPRHISINSNSRLMEACNRFVSNYKVNLEKYIMTERPNKENDILHNKNGDIINHPFQAQRDENLPYVHIGPMGAANILLKLAEYRDELIEKYNIRAFEMEGSGIADASWQGEVGYLIVRGVCDYGDDYKDDVWQEYAAAVSAAATRAILNELAE